MFNLSVNTSWSFPHSRLVTGFVTRLTRRVPLVEPELLTLLEHLSSPPVFNEVRVTRSLVLCICFVDRCFSFFWPLCCLFFFDIWILITPVVSSNSSSYRIIYIFKKYLLEYQNNICKNNSSFEGRDRHCHQYDSESEGMCYDTNDNVFKADVVVFIGNVIMCLTSH